MKHLLFALLGAAAILGVGMSYAPAEPFAIHVSKPMIVTDIKVFHRNVAVDNGDSCVTPQEIAGIRQKSGSFEKIALYLDEDGVKFKAGFAKFSNMSPEDQAKMDFWDGIDAYSFVAQDGTVMVQVTLYKKGADGVYCAVAGGTSPLTEWNTWVNAGALKPEASLLRPGFDPSVN